MTRLILALIALMLFSMQVEAAVAVGSKVNQTVSTGSSSTIAMTVAGADPLLIVVCSSNQSTVSAVAWNTSESLTFIDGDGVNFMETSAWGLVNPTAGAHNVSITLSGSDAHLCTGYVLTGASTWSSGLADIYLASGAAHSHNTTSPTDSLVIDAITLEPASGAATIVAGQTDRGNAVESDFSWATSTKPGAGTTSTGYTWPGDFSRWSHVALSIDPASAAGGSRNLMLMGVGK